MDFGTYFANGNRIFSYVQNRDFRNGNLKELIKLQKRKDHSKFITFSQEDTKTTFI